MSTKASEAPGGGLNDYSLTSIYVRLSGLPSQEISWADGVRECIFIKIKTLGRVLGTRTEHRILLARFLTRSGDQAWDFAVPIVLIKLLPGQFQMAAIYFLITKLLSVLTLPSLARVIDRWPRFRALQLGLSLQLVGVLLGIFSLAFLLSQGFFRMLLFLVLSGVLSSLGSAFVEIAISNDLVPTLFKDSQLIRVNARMRQLDLMTEVGSPLLAGVLLAFIADIYSIEWSLAAIALWNVLSLFPEYFLMRLIFEENPELDKKSVQENIDKPKLRENKWQATTLRRFIKHPLFLVTLAYSFLWFSVLSPHGVLLTLFLQDVWQMPEWVLGLFRGSGALFGLLATVLYPLLRKVLGINRVSRYFLLFQALSVIGACLCFGLSHTVGIWGFMAMVLLSRIGLYGFGLGEVELRQTRVSANQRGEFNGLAQSMNTFVSCLLFSFAVLVPSFESFSILIYSSAGFVSLALVIFLVWEKRQS